MKKLLQKRNSKKGFTLAELLIVVAIIAVLAAIAFPVFSAQLAKAKAGADLANLRAAISVASSELLTNGNITDQASAEAAVTKAIKDAMGTVQPQYGKSGDLSISVTYADGGSTVNRALCTFGGKSEADLMNVAKTGNETKTSPT